MATTAYELRLRQDARWAVAESGRFFEGTSELQRTLAKLVEQFDALAIAYVVIGGMALGAHGYARMTEDINVLLTRSDLVKLHEHLIGRGYTRLFRGSKNIRDTDTRQRQTSAHQLPEPADTEPVERDGVKIIGLPRLVELKLASGMTGGPDRARDLVDVQQLVKIANLSRDFSERMHPSSSSTTTTSRRPSMPGLS